MKKRFLAMVLAMYMLFMVGCSDVNKFLEEHGFGDSIYASMDEPKLSSDMVFLQMKDNTIDEQYIKKLLDSDREVGLIVEPVNYTYASVYETIDIIKEFIKKFDIELPIYYNINKFQGDIDTHRANALLADEFCCVLSANGVYCGLYGTDENMVSFAQVYSQYFNPGKLNEYDKMIVVSKEADDIKYDGIYNSVHVEETGKIYSNCDLHNIIVGVGLNNEANFVNHYVHVVNSNDENLDDMEEIAKKYGIKAENVFEYNYNIEKFNPYSLEHNMKLIIPNCYSGPNGEVLHYTDYTGNSNNLSNVDNGNYETWADISHNNGNINIQAISEVVDGIVLRCYSDLDSEHFCDGEYIEEQHYCPHADYSFSENLQKVRETGMPYGVYWVTNYANVSIEALKDEVAYVIALLKQNNCEEGTLVYWDVEPSVIDYAPLRENPNYWRERYEIISAIITEAGYTPGIYIHENDSKHFVDENGELPEYCWFATSNYYNTVISSQKQLLGYTDWDMIGNGIVSQVTQCGEIPGVYGYIDLNVAPKGTLTVETNKTYKKTQNAVG